MYYSLCIHWPRVTRYLDIIVATCLEYLNSRLYTAICATESFYVHVVFQSANVPNWIFHAYNVWLHVWSSINRLLELINITKLVSWLLWSNLPKLIFEKRSVLFCCIPRNCYQLYASCDKVQSWAMVKIKTMRYCAIPWLFSFRCRRPDVSNIWNRHASTYTYLFIYLFKRSRCQ